VEQTSIFFRFGAALFIGILIGLQREYAFNKLDKELSAGVRTFALMGLIGSAAAFSSDMLKSPWPFVGIVVIFGALLSVNYFIEAWRGEAGMTTEISAVLTVLAGALAYWNQVTLAVALGVITAVLLSAKIELHSFAKHLTRADVLSTLKFAVITAIILPILPNKNYGPEPFNLFNPYSIWLLVVLISGISFVGYVLIKIAGPSKGIGLTGFLGGLASSTAVTLNFAQRSRSNPELGKSFALAILIAWTVMFPRVFIIVFALSSGLAIQLLLPLGILVFVGAAYCLYLFRVLRTDKSNEQVSFSNPFELGPAIKFGLLFSIILLISKAAQIYLGNTGIYIASMVSGIADVDAISLSVTKLTQQVGGINFTIAARAIIFASVANTISKGGIVMIGGSKSLRRAVLPGFILISIFGIALALFI